MKKKEQWLQALDYLLELDGEVFLMEEGYWIKIEVCRVEPDDHRPHGIKYSLTLHDRYSTRVLGYDNAHAARPKRKKFSGKIVTWDHKHEGDRVRNYEFDSPGQLLEDFWTDVDELLKGE